MHQMREAESDVDMAARAWFIIKLKALSNKYLFMRSEEAASVEQHWRASLDSGAIRTLFLYMSGLPHEALVYFAYQYFIWHWNEEQEAWAVRNPSAAVVAALRYTYWCDREFIEEYRPFE